MISAIEVIDNDNNLILYRCFLNGNKPEVISFILSRHTYCIFKLYDTHFILNRMCIFIKSLSTYEYNKRDKRYYNFGEFDIKIINRHNFHIKKTEVYGPFSKIEIDRLNNNYLYKMNAKEIYSFILWKKDGCRMRFGLIECFGLPDSIEENLTRLFKLYETMVNSISWYILSSYIQASNNIFSKAYMSAILCVNHGEPSTSSKIITPSYDLVVSILKCKLKRIESHGRFYLSKDIKKWVYT